MLAPYPPAIRWATRSPLTTTTRSRLETRPRATSASANIASTSARRSCEASSWRRRCLAWAKLLMGRMAAVRMGGGTLSERQRELQRLFGDAAAGFRRRHQHVCLEHGQTFCLLVRDEPVEDALVVVGYP